MGAPIVPMLHLGCVAWAVCFAITGVSSTASTLSSSCSDFVPSTICSEQDWAGAWKDLFSPDDPCPYSMRYVDYTAYDSGATQALHVSASDTDADCNSTWGRKYDVSSSVDPVIQLSTLNPCMANVSFASKVPAGSRAAELAAAGALDFDLTLGRQSGAAAHSTIQWGGMYHGAGGTWVSPAPNGDDFQVPAVSCDNMWQRVETSVSDKYTDAEKAGIAIAAFVGTLVFAAIAGTVVQLVSPVTNH